MNNTVLLNFTPQDEKNDIGFYERGDKLWPEEKIVTCQHTIRKKKHLNWVRVVSKFCERQTREETVTDLTFVMKHPTGYRPVTRILFGGVLTRPKWTKLPKCIFYLILFNWRPVNFSFFFLFFLIFIYIFNFIIFFKRRLASSTQELILVTLFILRPVSSDQTDFIRDSNKMYKGN